MLLGHFRSKRPHEEAGPSGALVPWEERVRHRKKGSPLPALSRGPLQVTSPTSGKEKEKEQELLLSSLS